MSARSGIIIALSAALLSGCTTLELMKVSATEALTVEGRECPGVGFRPPYELTRTRAKYMEYCAAIPADCVYDGGGYFDKGTSYYFRSRCYHEAAQLFKDPGLCTYVHSTNPHNENMISKAQCRKKVKGW